MAWIIKGEAGRTLDATARSLADLNISSATLRFQSLAGDSLTWTAETIDATGAGTIVPDIGQIVELWWDSTRKFKGYVTAPKVGMRQITITVEGPWWWLDRIHLTSDVLPYAGASSGSAERATYRLATGSLKAHIETIINRSITNGAPITLGTVATMFDVPNMTLSEQSCASALATLLGWCPEAVSWFDYSGTVPTLNVYRRDPTETTAITYTNGTDAVELCDLTPRLDLEVKLVDLNFVTRTATTGRPAWASQTASAGTPTAGQRQIVTVSGPEIVDYLPKDDFATETIQTVAAGIYEYDQVYALDPVLKSAVDEYGYVQWSPSFWGAVGSRPALDPAILSGHRIIAGTYQDWMAKGSGTRPAITRTTTRVAGWLYFSYVTGTGIPGGGYGNAVASLIEQGRAIGGYYTISGTGHYIWAYFCDYQIETIDVSYTTATALYKAWEYDYLVPPAGLAAALRDAQNWVPWEGPLTLVGDDCSGDNLLPHKYHLAGTLPVCATMGALARGVTHELMRGRTVIDLGAPARLDFGSLVSRIRREPQDNIVYL